MDALGRKWTLSSLSRRILAFGQKLFRDTPYTRQACLIIHGSRMYSCGAASCNHVRQPRATCIASYRVGALSRRASAGGPAGADERTSGRTDGHWGVRFDLCLANQFRVKGTSASVKGQTSPSDRRGGSSKYDCRVHFALAASGDQRPSRLPHSTSCTVLLLCVNNLNIRS